MKRNRKNLKKPRTKAYKNQKGRCYYCDRKMWLTHPDELKELYLLTPNQAKNLQCTGEHLEAFKDGGSCSSANIVAACKWCNTKRHARKVELTVRNFKALVKQRLKNGAWLPFKLIESPRLNL